MFRKSLLALAAVAALGALSSTEASAGWGKFKFGWHGGWGHHHFYKPYWGYAGYGGGYNCFVVKKYTPWGVKFKKVCHY
jgi:hypothetical protein